MELKEYREMPDEGLFEKIERRVRLRRVARVTGMVLAAAVVVGVALWGSNYQSSRLQDHQTSSPWVSLSRPLDVSMTRCLDDYSNGTASQVAEAGVVGRADGIPQGSAHGSKVGGQRLEAGDATQVDGGSPATDSETPNSELRTPNSELRTRKAVANEVAVVEPVAGRQEEGTEAVVTKSANTETSPRTTETATANSGTGNAKSGTPSTTATENVLWAPNIIAPMADDAANREFKVQSTTAVSNFQIVIYNRGGRKVFSTDNIDQAWDATYNGSMLPQGAYVWVARFRDAEGVLRQEKGSVVVVR